MTALHKSRSEDIAFRPVRRNRVVVFPSIEGTGLKLRKSLRKLCALRIARGVPLGVHRDWVRAAAYIAAMLDDQEVKAASLDNVRACLASIGYENTEAPLLDMVWTAWEVGAANREGLMPSSARLMGDLVQITREEREQIKSTCLDAIDEPAEKRRKRLKAESAARSRAKKNAAYKPRSKSDAQTKPWLALNVGQRTWQRWSKEKRMAAIRGALSLKKDMDVHETPPPSDDVHETPPNNGVLDDAA